MPSRKKAKGKARKAAKEAKEAEAARAKEEESRAVEVAAGQHCVQESVEAQMQRLTICSHGCPSISAGEVKICEDFINAFLDAFFSEVDVVYAFLKATNTTVEVYEEIYDSKLDTVISMILYNGTQCILDGNNGQAKLHASLACYFEEYHAFHVCKRKAMINWTKPFELLRAADDHTLVSFYKKVFLVPAWMKSTKRSSP